MTGRRVPSEANVATTGRWRLLLWLLSLFSACVSHGGRRSVAFVPRCEIHHSFPEPPSPPWISGMSESTKALSADNGASILNVTHPCGSSFQTSSNSLPLSRFGWSYSHNSAHTVVATGHSRSWIFTFPSFTFASPPVAQLPNGRTIFFSAGPESVDPWAQFVAYILAHMMSSLLRWAEIMEQANSNRFKRFSSSLSLQFTDFFLPPTQIGMFFN